MIQLKHFFFYMKSLEIALFENESKDFLSKNKPKYHAFKELNKHIRNLTPETYQDILQFIQSNHEIFFKNHANASEFFIFYNESMWPYFKNLEMYMDVIIYFKDEFKRLDFTEKEILLIYPSYMTFINILFHKKFFSIEFIVEKSIYDDYIFVNFLPEIREYDPEYAIIRERTLFDSLKGEYLTFIKEFKELVDSDPKKHVKNRNLSYNPTLLHKSIRDDDIDMFQSIISRNGIDINYQIPSCVYERSQTSCKQSKSLLYVATSYGSKKIVKFLLLQPQISIDSDIILAACISNDLDMIHYYLEKGFSANEAMTAVICYYQKDILNYFLENGLNDCEENDPLIKEAIKNKFPDDADHLYYKLNSFDLLQSINMMNFQVIKKCLPKILCIYKNSELQRTNEFLKKTGFSYLASSASDLELFEFLYDHRNRSIKKYPVDDHVYTFLDTIDSNRNDACMFLYEKFGYRVNRHDLLSFCLGKNIKMSNFLLDKQLKEIEDGVQFGKKAIYADICKSINFNDFKKAINHYNEDILVKMFTLYSFAIKNEDLEELFEILSSKLSNRMIIKFLDRINFDWKNSYLLDALESLNLTELLNYVIAKIQ